MTIQLDSISILRHFINIQMIYLLSIIILQIRIIALYEHEIRKSSCLNGSLPGHTFEFEPAHPTHRVVQFFIDVYFCCKVTNGLKIFKTLLRICSYWNFVLIKRKKYFCSHLSTSLYVNQIVLIVIFKVFAFFS